MSRDYVSLVPMAGNLGFARGVHILEDCEGTCNWVAVGTGGDDVHDFATAAAFMGTYGMRLTTRTTGAAADDWLDFTRVMAWPESGRLIARAKYMMPATAVCKYIELILTWSDGVNAYAGVLRYQISNGSLWYQNSAGTYTQISDYTGPVLGLQWLNIELVVSCVDNQYLEAMFNGVRKDLTAVAARLTGAYAFRTAGVGISLYAAGAAAATMFADNIYVGEIE